MSQRTGATAILTPDSRNRLIRDALDTVRTRQWTRANGESFGPYPFAWEIRDSEIADALLEEIALPENANFPEALSALSPFAENAVVANVINRLD
jgi:hypothetical protein